MRIVLDAMGGDSGPSTAVKGAASAAREQGMEVILVGRESVVRPEMEKHAVKGANLSFVPAEETVEMGEHPTKAVRQKKDSSIVVGINLLKKKEADAFVSAGNSGAVMAAALLTLGRVPGIERPAIGSVFPTKTGVCILLDAGANLDCRPANLVQFAYMGNAYMQRVFGIERPRVAVLSVGEEETKGTVLVQETHQLLKITDMNFVGNVDGKDIPLGACDVVVTDGFTGNAVIKVSEGLGEELAHLIEKGTSTRLEYRLVYGIIRPLLRSVLRRLDYTEYGGAPLLGVNGNVIIAHGRSDGKTIANAIRTARRVQAEGVLEAVTAAGAMI
ncbi:MAG: phosphate acyltransferase PlsX [Chloroflexota bacterium]